jgi:hypothetical protein
MIGTCQIVDGRHANIKVLKYIDGKKPKSPYLVLYGKDYFKQEQKSHLGISLQHLSSTLAVLSKVDCSDIVEKHDFSEHVD